MDWFSFIGGYFLGGSMGLLIGCVLVAGKDSEAEAEEADMASRSYRADATINRKEAAE